MLAKYEEREFSDGLKVWAGKYESVQNIAHWHNEAELIHVDRGTARIGVNGQTYAAVPGDTFFFSGGDIHYVSSEEGSICTFFIFDERCVIPGAEGLVPESPKLQKTYPIDQCYHQLKQEFEKKTLLYQEKIKTILASLLITLFRSESIRKKEYPKESQTIAAYRALLQEIDTNYSEMTFEQAAQFMGFTAPHFSRVFSKLSGMTFTDYINMVKIEKAVEWIKKDDISVTEVSIRCGFNSIRHFNRVFKNIAGITPKEVTPDFNLHSTPRKVRNTKFDPTMSTSKLIL